MATRGAVEVKENGKLKVLVLAWADGGGAYDLARTLFDKHTTLAEEIAQAAIQADMFSHPVIMIVSQDYADQQLEYFAHEQTHTVEFDSDGQNSLR